MKLLKNFALAAALAAICVLCSSCASKPKLIDTAANNEKLSYSESYTELSEKRTNKTKAWRRGMVGGNGLEGFITSGSPYSDTIIYQNMHFIMPNINARTCPDTSSELEQVKQSIVKCEDIVDNASYDDVYRFHPGGQLRINSERHRIKDYIRYTDYETAQVGVKYTDKNGTWERTTFTSLADGVTVTKIEKSSKNAPVNITLSYDDISTMANYSEGDEVKKNDIILKFSSGGTARAPMDGTLSNLYVEEGDEVTMGQQLLRVADYSNPQIVFNVDEYDRPALSVGQTADVTVLSTGKVLTGTITRIAQEATVSGDMAYYEVTMTVPQDGTLAMGLSCEIRVLYQSVKNVTTVSIDAIQYDSDGKPFVYCYDRKDDIVQQRVTLGINNGSIVEIVDGIRTGEAVLIPVKNTMEMPMMHY